MNVTESIKQKLDQAAAIIRMQTARIEELEAENERLKAGPGAHATLRLIYSDPSAPRSDRIKAASASLPHETPKLMPERAPLELKAVESERTLGERCEVAMARADQMGALSLEERSALIDRARRNGNGADDGGNGDDGKDD
jgi:hypothetical protein